MVIDGLTEEDIKKAMSVGIKDIIDSGEKTIISISAGNYGGEFRTTLI